MKKIKLILIASIILTGAILVFLILNQSSNPITEHSLTYNGFMNVQVGQWVVYSIPNGLEEKMYYVGEENINGKKAVGLEVQLKNSSGHVATFQIWVEPETKKLIKYVGRIKGKILCVEGEKAIKDLPMLPPLVGTPDKYKSDKVVGFMNLTVNAGKKVLAAKFAVNDTEVLASSQVPFGIVSAKSKEGVMLMALTDYGLDGAGRTITRKELDNCVPI